MIGNFSMRVMSCLRVIVTQKQLARSAEEIQRHTEAAREICNKFISTCTVYGYGSHNPLYLCAGTSTASPPRSI